jgi:hypothetical protein
MDSPTHGGSLPSGVIPHYPRAARTDPFVLEGRPLGRLLPDWQKLIGAWFELQLPGRFGQMRLDRRPRQQMLELNFDGPAIFPVLLLDQSDEKCRRTLHVVQVLICQPIPVIFYPTPDLGPPSRKLVPVHGSPPRFAVGATANARRNTNDSVSGMPARWTRQTLPPKCEGRRRRGSPTLLCSPSFMRGQASLRGRFPSNTFPEMCRLFRPQPTDFSLQAPVNPHCCRRLPSRGIL